MGDMESLMGEMQESKVPAVPASGMDTTEIKEFLEYVVGDVAEPPAVMNKIMNNLIQKLSMGLGYNVVSNIGRQANLSKFLAEAENRLFDPDDVKDMDAKDLAERYKSAGKTLNDLFEVQRKFIVQNKEMFKTDQTPQEKMVSKLMTLPPEKLEAVMKKIDDAINGTDESVKKGEEEPEEITEEDLV